MSVDERIPQYRRRSIRLRHHDYRREGAYLVTICAYEHTSIFGSIANGQVRLSNRKWTDRKSTRLNSSHDQISYAVFCLKKKSGVTLDDRSHLVLDATLHSIN